MQKTVFSAAMVLGLALASATPASALTPLTPLVADGISYTLNEDSISADDLTAMFTFTASNINVAGTDTELGRTGVNAIAFSLPKFTDPTTGTVTGAMTAPPGFSFKLGGLNSSGCNLTGNFFCFSNTSASFPSPLPSSLTFTFNVTANQAGLWEAYAPDLKIDWTGSQNNYDLVSKPILVGGEPTPTQFSVTPEPATWAMMILGFGFIGAMMRRQRRHEAVKLTYA
jgi:hypothetical protein